MDVNKDYIENLAKEIAAKLSMQCVYTNEETMKVSYMLLEKMFADHLGFEMTMELRKQQRRHFPKKDRVF
jgi:hypothetical protein